MQLNYIKHLERLARSDSSILSLGQGIPTGQPDPYITQFCIEQLQTNSDIYRYSDPAGIPQLRQAISEQLHIEGIQYSAYEVLVTAGAIEALNCTLQSLVTSQKSEVILVTPAYSAYERCIALAGGTVKPVALSEDNNWELNPEKIVHQINPKTACILLCNPNNPTGSVYSKTVLQRICEAAKAHGIIVIIDEVYGNMLYDDINFYTPAIEPRFKGTIVRIVSFSKDFCLSGWRIGYLHTSEELIKKITPIHDTLVNCAPVISQYAALAAIQIHDKIIANNTTHYTIMREKICAFLDGCPDVFSYTMPTGGYFVFAKLLQTKDDVAFCQKLAEEAKVIVIPGSDFGLAGSGYIRICFGRDTDTVIESIKRLRRYL